MQLGGMLVAGFNWIPFGSPSVIIAIRLFAGLLSASG